MFEPNLSIDVSLLAIILGLYATKNDRNLILVLICALFAHVLLTNDEDDLNAGVLQNASTVAVTNDGLGAAVTGGVATAVTPTTVAKDDNPVAPDGFKSTVSSGVFDRQLSTPQTNFTSTVFPSTSEEANGKLASARDSFFESLVS
ncbi:unnamed protein product [Ectocarpus sp. 8 AP-2014]